MAHWLSLTALTKSNLRRERRKRLVVEKRHANWKEFSFCCFGLTFAATWQDVIITELIFCAANQKSKLHFSHVIRPTVHRSV